MLWLALHLPRLPIEVFLRARDPAVGGSAAAPFAVGEAGSPPRLLIVTPEAERLGLAPGMAASAAYALAPDLVIRPRDRTLERATLDSLALWAEQFTPMLHVAEPDALLLEVAGCLRLFGGLDPLADRAADDLAHLGFDPRLACAPTPTGALLLVRNGFDSRITDLDTLRARLAQLPVDGLAVDDTTVQRLRGMGMRTVADCLRLPRDGLARRAGPTLLDHLDRALGHRPDPRAPFVPPPRFASRVVLPVPVHEVEPLLFAARRLVGELAGFLAGRTAGVTRFTLRLEHERRPPTCVPIELSMPNRDAAHLTALVRERLSRTALPAATEAIALDCDETQQLAPRNFTLFASDEVTTEHRVALVERLRARLGHDAVHGLEFVPRHRPELAHHESEPGHAIHPTATPPRPLWLLATPEPMASAALHPLAGPERIESGWWDGRDAQRDYFIATRTDGSVVWVYRELDDSAVRWFVQGWFA